MARPWGQQAADNDVHPTSTSDRAIKQRHRAVTANLPLERDGLRLATGGGSDGSAAMQMLGVEPPRKFSGSRKKREPNPRHTDDPTMASMPPASSARGMARSNLEECSRSTTAASKLVVPKID